MIESDLKPQLEKATKDLKDILSNYSGELDRFRLKVFQLSNLIRFCARQTEIDMSYGHSGELLSLEGKQRRREKYKRVVLESLIDYDRVMVEWELMQQKHK